MFGKRVENIEEMRSYYKNVPAHTSEIVKQFLKSERVTVLPPHRTLQI